MDSGDGRVLCWKSTNHSERFCQSWDCGALGGHVDRQEREQNDREDETDKEYESDDDENQDMMDLTGDD